MTWYDAGRVALWILLSAAIYHWGYVDGERAGVRRGIRFGRFLAIMGTGKISVALAKLRRRSGLSVRDFFDR